MSDGKEGSDSSGLTVVDTLKWVGQLVADGKPVVTLPKQMANAVPNVRNWQQNRVKTATSKPWGYWWRNALDWELASVTMQLNLEYGAQYRGGGAFITNCYVDVLACQAMWRCNLDVSFESKPPSIDADSKAPIARLPLLVSATITTPSFTQTKKWAFTVYGDGRLEPHGY